MYTHIASSFIKRDWKLQAVCRWGSLQRVGPLPRKVRPRRFISAAPWCWTNHILGAATVDGRNPAPVENGGFIGVSKNL